MAMLRFVHTADLHLDSPFKGIHEKAPQHVSDSLRRATFDAYGKIIDLCITESVDALLIAGDVFDGADRSLRAQLKFVDGLNRLDASGIRSFVCHGNHDPLDGWEARLAYPPGCHRFGDTVEAVPVFEDDPERVVVCGISYHHREVRENLVPLFQDITQGDFIIGLLHANVGGNPDHDSYAPCTVQDLADTSINYWALGHVHTPQVLNQRHPTVIYPGNPQGRHPNEPGARGVYLVEVSEGGEVTPKFMPVDVLRWELIKVDIGDLETEQDLLDAIDEEVATCRERCEGRSVVFRLELNGRGALHTTLTRPGVVASIYEQVNERWSDQNSWLWCERIQLATGRQLDRNQILLREDFLGDLSRLCDELRFEDGGLQELGDQLITLFNSPSTRHYLRDFLPVGEELVHLLGAAEEECLNVLIEEDDNP